ncbi:alkaline phosphatase, partial [Klebsiella pneumoniae]
AKNVILLIGDGMGDSEITAARNYAEGAGGFFKGIDALPLTGQYTHYSLDKKTGKPDYVTDSAASATAWTTGVKTYNGALGVDIHENAHQTILELAKAAGLATGNVSTAELQDATPAALVAHVTSRKCYGPTVTSEKCPSNALEKGGKGSITEQ